MTGHFWISYFVAILITTLGASSSNEQGAQIDDPTDPYSQTPIKAKLRDNTLEYQSNPDISDTKCHYTDRHGPQLPSESRYLDDCEKELSTLRRDQAYTRRLLQNLRSQFESTPSCLEYTIKLKFENQNIQDMQDSLEYGEPVADKVDLLLNSIIQVKPLTDDSETLFPWLEKYRSDIVLVLQVLLIIALPIAILRSLYYLWLYLGGRAFVLLLIMFCFLVSVPWTWFHLYKKNLADRFHRSQSEYALDRECTPSNLPWYSIVFQSYDKKCQRFYHDQVIDPLWEVKPTQAIAVTFVEFFWTPLSIMGEPIGVFLRDALDPLPFYLKPFIAILGLLLFGLCMAILLGMRISSWFFTIEPANTAQSQMTAITGVLSDLQALTDSLQNENRRRDASIDKMIKAIDQQSSSQVEFTELLPVLEAFCADYVHEKSAVQHTSPGAGGDQMSPVKSILHNNTSKNKMVLDQCLIMEFDHMVLTTPNPEAIIEFYTQKLGMTLKEFKGGRKALHCTSFKINIHKKGQEISPHADKPDVGTLDVCLRCGGDVQSTVEHLKAMEVDIELGPCARTGALGPITSVYIRDPDRNLIELAHYPSSTVDTITYSDNQVSSQL